MKSDAKIIIENNRKIENILESSMEIAALDKNLSSMKKVRESLAKILFEIDNIDSILS